MVGTCTRSQSSQTPTHHMYTIMPPHIVCISQRYANVGYTALEHTVDSYGNCSIGRVRMRPQTFRLRLYSVHSQTHTVIYAKYNPIHVRSFLVALSSGLVPQYVTLRLLLPDCAVASHWSPLQILHSFGIGLLDEDPCVDSCALLYFE